MQVSNDIQKIIQNYINEVEQAKDSSRLQKKVSKQNQAVKRDDSVEISRDAADFQRAKKLYNELSSNEPSGVRKKKVEEISEKINNNEYNPPSREVAEKVISNYLIDTLV